MSFKNGIFALAFTFNLVPFFAHAFVVADLTKTGCKLEGKIVLDDDTRFTCRTNQNLVLASNAVIIDHGHDIELKSERDVDDQGVTINTVDVLDDPKTTQEMDSGDVMVTAENMTGACKEIHLDGFKNGAGGTFAFVGVVSLGTYKCHNFTFNGAGQGVSGAIAAWDTNGNRIPFSTIKAKVIDL